MTCTHTPPSSTLPPCTLPWVLPPAGGTLSSNRSFTRLLLISPKKLVVSWTQRQGNPPPPVLSDGLQEAAGSSFYHFQPKPQFDKTVINFAKIGRALDPPACSGSAGSLWRERGTHPGPLSARHEPEPPPTEFHSSALFFKLVPGSLWF